MNREQQLKMYLGAHQRRVERVLAPLPKERAAIREAGLDRLLDFVFPQRVGTIVTIEPRSPETTSQLLVDLTGIFTECVTTTPIQRRIVVETAWPRKIIKPREFEVAYKYFALDGYERNEEQTIRAIKWIQDKAPANRITRLNGRLRDIQNKLAFDPTYNALLGQYVELAPTYRSGLSPFVPRF